MPAPVTDRLVARLLAAVLAVLALYGCWSTPGLVARWGASREGLALLAGWSLVAAWALSTTVRRPRRVEIAGFALAAVALRIGSGWIAAGRWSPGDSHAYLELARNVLAGRGLVVVEPFMGQSVRAFFPPAYPLLLAGWGLVAGLSAGSVLIVSTLVDLAAASLIVRLGRALGSRRAGFAAAALYLVWPSTLFSAPLAQKEGMEVVLIVALALGWLAARRPGRARWLAIGVPAGLLALTQPGQAALAGLFGIALLPWLGWRRLLRVGVPAALVAVVVMAPWWIRNRLVMGGFVPLTSAGGLSLWIGENPDAAGTWMPYPAALAGLPELAYARAAGRMATQWMAAHPARVLTLNAAKFVRAAGVGQFGITRLAAMRPALTPALAAALLPLSHGAQVAMLGGGAAALARRPGVSPMVVALIAACVVQLAVFGVWFEFGERHREFVTPFLLLAIADAIRRRTAPSASALPPPAA
ncbi:MAG: hypothetical protein ACRYFW_06030 [Janthinobacterium lividum]